MDRALFGNYGWKAAGELGLVGWEELLLAFNLVHVARMLGCMRGAAEVTEERNRTSQNRHIPEGTKPDRDLGRKGSLPIQHLVRVPAAC